MQIFSQIYELNREPFGEKCKCNHYESEHASVKKRNSIEALTQDYAYLIPPAEIPSQFTRGKCKICTCNEFLPKK